MAFHDRAGFRTLRALTTANDQRLRRVADKPKPSHDSA